MIVINRQIRRRREDPGYDEDVQLQQVLQQSATEADMDPELQHALQASMQSHSYDAARARDPQEEQRKLEGPSVGVGRRRVRLVGVWTAVM